MNPRVNLRGITGTVYRLRLRQSTLQHVRRKLDSPTYHRGDQAWLRADEVAHLIACGAGLRYHEWLVGPFVWSGSMAPRWWIFDHIPEVLSITPEELTEEKPL